MRIVRDYFGDDRTTVTYENEITGVGGNVDEFFIIAEGWKVSGTPTVRTAVHFTHDEMAHLLADYRGHHPLEHMHCRALAGPADTFLQRLRRRVAAFFGR